MGSNILKPQKRVAYFDVLNIAATFGVIMLHCNGIAHTYSETLAWYQALLVEVLIYWPVPIFFMLSGATLMGYRDRLVWRFCLKKDSCSQKYCSLIFTSKKVFFLACFFLLLLVYYC